MMCSGELLLIDMDTLAVGDPIFEFAGIYNTYKQYVELDHNNAMEFLGLSYETTGYIWDRTLQTYLEGESEEKIALTEKKAQVLGCLHILSSSQRTKNEYKRSLGKLCAEHIIDVVPMLDDLTL